MVQDACPVAYELSQFHSIQFGFDEHIVTNGSEGSGKFLDRDEIDNCCHWLKTELAQMAEH